MRKLDGFPGFGYAAESDADAEALAADVRNGLRQIQAVQSGRDLLDDIARARPAAHTGNNGPQEISFPDDVNVVFLPSLKPDHRSSQHQISYNVTRDHTAGSSGGGGSVSFLYFTNRVVETTPEGDTCNYIIILIHELLHSLHAVRGEMDPLDEEDVTVGLGPYRNRGPTENTFRLALGMPVRERYF